MNRADLDVTDEELAEWFRNSIAYHDGVAYYHDENIAKSTASLLRGEGVRATSVYEYGQLGEPSDIRILLKARELGCILVTIDEDFEEIHQRLEQLKGLYHAGILLVTSKVMKRDIEQLVHTLHRLAQKYEGYPDWLVNQIYTV